MSDTDGKINWFEVPATDAARARTFYGQLFGWQLQPFAGSDDYQVTSEAGGAVFTDPERKGILVYFGTADVDASVTRVRELGGEAGEVQDIPNVGRYAHCTDTEGNQFGLFQNEM